MQIVATCPRCSATLLPSSKACACGWRSRQEVLTEAGPSLCAWNDQGELCRDRGSLSHSTTGSGPWYCREHYYRLMGYADMQAEGLHGNQVPKKPLHSFAVDQVRGRLK